jgi:hypothetical protein
VLAVGLAALLVGPAFADPALLPEFDPDDFEKGAAIDNPYWPLIPGTTFVYEAEVEDEIETNTVTVTHKKKKILGVTCVVVLDMEYEDDLLVERTYDWYAQDKEGNIWYFGEDSESYEYDDDDNLIEVSDEGSWEAGVDGALPGIIMLGDPQIGDAYRQEYYEDEAEDMAKVLRVDATVCTGLGCCEDCLVTKEWTPLEPGEVEHKHYAPGVGLVLISELSGGKTKQVELVEIIGPGKTDF